MNSKNKQQSPTSSSDGRKEKGANQRELDALKDLLDTSFGYIFAQSIIDATDDKAREKILNEIIDNKALSKKRIEYLGVHIAYMKTEKEEKVELVSKWAELLMRNYLRRHQQIQSRGVEISVFLGDELIESFGHALDEGITEYLTQKISSVAFQDKYSEKEIMEMLDFERPYKFETRMAEELIKRTGEELVMKAQFGGELEQLMTKVDTLYGQGAYLQLLKLSDQGNWRDVFSLLSRVPPQTTNKAKGV